MKTTLLLIAVTVFCVGCNEEALKKKDEEIAALKATYDKDIAALKAEKKAAVADVIAKLRPPGPDMPELHRRLALPIEVGAALLFAILIVATIKALIRQMAQIDQQHGAHIGGIMVLVGVVTTVGASMIAPVWVGFPYQPALWITTMARPATGWGILWAILVAALASFGIAYFLMKLRGSEIPSELKWGCSLMILGLTFVGSHYNLACCSIIYNIGSSTGYLIYPVSVGGFIGGMLGTAAYWIANPRPEPYQVALLPSERERQVQIAALTRESSVARSADESEETISKYLPRLAELIVRMLSVRH